MAGMSETRARVYWSLMERFRGREVVYPKDAPEVAQNVAETLQTILEERTEHLLIIDGMNMFIRSFVVVPTMDANGQDVGGLTGTLRSLKRFVSETSCTRAIVVWDGAGGSAKRRSVFKEYKAGRKPRLNRELDDATPDESRRNMQDQLGRCVEYLDLLGIDQVRVDDVEADDVIAFIARHLYPHVPKTIVSSDKDFFQLINEWTSVYSLSKKLLYRSSEVQEQFLVRPENFVYLRAITGAGDKSDNIEGIKGLGPKTLLKLFPFLAERESSLDEIFQSCATNNDKNRWFPIIQAQRDIIYRNVGLMQLSTPTIGSGSIAQIRHALERPAKEPVMTEVKLRLLRDGIQITDGDMFSVFRDYHRRAKRSEEKE